MNKYKKFNKFKFQECVLVKITVDSKQIFYN